MLFVLKAQDTYVQQIQKSSLLWSTLHPSVTIAPSRALLPPPYLQQWVGYAGLLWELHKQELAKLNHSRRAREKSLKKELEEERERVYAAVSEERDASVAQRQAAQEVKQAGGLQPN